MYESLHNHTVISDGAQTHLESLNDAQELGIGVMALTDHDALPDQTILAGLQKYDGPVKWLLGVELSSWVPKAVGGPEKGGVHILGLFVDVKNRPLQEFCAEAEESRHKRMRLYVKHLQSVGFDVSEEDVQAAATSSNIGKPHMVKAVLAKAANRAVMEKLRVQMEHEAEHDEKIKARYGQMMSDGPNQYPYALFMGGEAYRPMSRDFSSTMLDYESTVKLIREAGGLAVAAHWYLDSDKMGRSDMEAVLAAEGLDGLESKTINVIFERDVSQSTVETQDLAKKYDVFDIVTSDSHKRADLEAFVHDPMAKSTVGETARLIEKFRPDLQWSNLG